RNLGLATAVGIDDVRSGALPAEKAEVVARLQERGRTVAMVGDGVNDAGALAQADLGIALGSGTDLAAASADVTLVRDDLVAVTEAVLLSRRILRTVRVNLGWAFGYNVLALPVAAAGLLNPMLAGAAMATGSLLVVGNSLRLQSRRGQDTTRPT
uniref:HAD-IC family P-type ATPase n=1 Tax=Pseudonocardia pini TaxID=2758030 RepID=UPI0015F02DD0